MLGLPKATEINRPLLKKIEQLERQARSEKQPRRKWELAAEVGRLRDNTTQTHNITMSHSMF